MKNPNARKVAHDVNGAGCSTRDFSRYAIESHSDTFPSPEGEFSSTLIGYAILSTYSSTSLPLWSEFREPLAGMRRFCCGGEYIRVATFGDQLSVARLAKLCNPKLGGMSVSSADAGAVAKG